MCPDCARERAAREEAEAEAEENRRTAEAAVKFLGRIAEATWNAGLPGGDREQTLKNVNALVSALAAEREAHEETRKEINALTNERNAALELAEQRGAAYDMTWREVESLREWKDKLEAEVDEITALVDKWRSGRAHLGTPATFVDQRLLDGILNVGVSVSGQRGGTVTFSHWSGAATKPDEEHGAKCECCKGDGHYGVADGDGDVDTIICESLVSQRDSWHKEAEAWKQTAANLQARADRFEFLRELLVAVVKTGTKDPLLDARLMEELRSHE